MAFPLPIPAPPDRRASRATPAGAPTVVAWRAVYLDGPCAGLVEWTTAPAASVYLFASGRRVAGPPGTAPAPAPGDQLLGLYEPSLDMDGLALSWQARAG